MCDHRYVIGESSFLVTLPKNRVDSDFSLQTVCSYTICFFVKFFDEGTKIRKRVEKEISIDVP